jgi:hypothetical protein
MCRVASVFKEAPRTGQTMDKNPHYRRDKAACRLGPGRPAGLPVSIAVAAVVALPAVDRRIDESEGVGS